jgi:hemolysin-activating ACP:hemolysin acyltransferase
VNKVAANCFFQPGKLYKFESALYVKKNDKEYYLEKNEILFFVERWNSHNDIYFKFLKPNGQVIDVEGCWTNILLKHLKRIKTNGG